MTPMRTHPAFALAGAVLLASCAYPTRNLPLDTMSKQYGYRWSNLGRDDMPDTLVIVTASGGGTRASLLSLAVLQGMNAVKLPSSKTLADEIDVISSVSGGSVTSGYFALHGAKGLPELTGFLRRDGIADLAWRVLNPVALAKLSTPSYERIDPQIERFDENLFHGATFQTLEGRRPFLILNAADMVESVPFPLTQFSFDLICSDLSKLKLATGVSASAAFPVALSPVTLTNYSRCPAQEKTGWKLPQWVQNATETSWYDNAEFLAQGRVAKAYADGTQAPHPKRYIHLLDGGIADNLGVAEPYRMLTSPDSDPSFYNDSSTGRIKKLIFVMVNSRSAAASDLDRSAATPGVLDMLNGTINAGIDRTTMGAAQRVENLLRAELESQADDADENGAPEIAANLRSLGKHAYFVGIDFDAIDNADCRLAYHSIATSWTLPKTQIDALLKMGPALLAANPNFKAAVTDLGGRMPDDMPSVDGACRALAE